MWANGDLLNVLYDRACEDDILKQDKTFKFTEIQEVNGIYYSAFIGIPAIDPLSGESTCPERFTTEKLMKKKSHMSQYLWSAVYMQNPIAPEGLEFTWEQLTCYDKLPSDKPITIRASLDPARKGKNYVSMPIFAQYKDDDRWYLIDCLYKKLSMKELYQDICYKIINNKVNQLVVENNTDTSLKHVLEEMLKKMNYFNCTIYEVYSFQNKEQRIKDNQGDVRNRLVFPRKNMFNESTEIGQFMQSVTSYSFSYPNKFDDAIDSAVLFIQKFVDDTLNVPKMSTFNRRSLGF